MSEKLISSKHTKLLKKKLTIIIYVIIGIAILVSFLGNNEPLRLGELIFAIFGIGFLLLIIQSIQKNFFDILADEVYDCGNFIKVKHEKRSGSLPLSKIINVGYGSHANKGKTQITLTTSEKFMSSMKDDKVIFLLNENFGLESKQYIDQLIKRIDEARRNDS